MNPARAIPESHDDAICVLLCEPELEHAYAVTDALARSQDVFQVAHVDDLDGALAALTARPFDAAIIDVSTLGNPIDAAMLRVVSVSPATSIILVCDDDDQARAMAGVRHGAHDYVIREVASGASLVRRIHAALERHNSKANLHFLAHHDVLTELANRVFFNQCLEASITRSTESRTLVTVLFVDLDGFKPVNDTYGHDAGDSVLKAVARRLRAVVPHVSVVARLGGDEFAILVEHLPDPGSAVDLARQVVDAVSQPIQIGSGTDVEVSCSIGVATTRGDCAPAELVKRADEAMYRAKRAGGRGIQVAPSRAEPKLASRLAGAIERGELELFYQPQVDRAGQMFGVEALLRWNRNGDVIRPSDFVPQLEESGLIVPVGWWVIRTAVRQLVTWREEGVVVPRMAVNVSPLQLARRGFADHVAEILQEMKVQPGSLEIEVTERVVLSDNGATHANLEALRSNGVKVALDDFGTGYASLSYLHRYPVDTLKVDRSFVKDIDTNTRSYSIVGSILDLARRLGVVVVAEGVERRVQADLLRREGCDVLQGFLFGQPQSAAQLPVLQEVLQ